MKIEVLLIWRQNRAQKSATCPTRYSIFHQTSKLSEHGAYTTHAYAWTKDNFWNCLRNVFISSGENIGKDEKSIGVQPGNCSSSTYSAFRAVVDVAYNEEDRNVLLLLGREITRVMHTPGYCSIACRVSLVRESERGTSQNSEKLLPWNLACTDILLVHIALHIRGGKDFLRTLASADNATGLEFHNAMQGRMWFINGQVRVVSSAVGASIRFTQATQTLEGKVDDLFDGAEAILTGEEQHLSGEIVKWLLGTISSQMRYSARVCFAFLPPVLAAVVKGLTRSLLQECLCYHLIDFPVRYTLQFHPVVGKKKEVSSVMVNPLVSQTSLWASESSSGFFFTDEKCCSMKAENKILGKVQEEVTASHVHTRAVRTPVEALPVYLYYLLLRETSLAPSLFLSTSFSFSCDSVPVDYLDEVRMGIQISYALERWKQFLQKREKATIYRCCSTSSNKLVSNILLKILEEAKSQLQVFIDPKFPETVSEKYRRFIMAPYPLTFSPVLQLNSISTASQNKESLENIAVKQHFAEFDKAMMKTCFERVGNDSEEDELNIDEIGKEDVSIASSESRGSSTWEVMSLDSRSIRDDREEVENIFFDDLHLATAETKEDPASEDSIKLDVEVVKNVVINPIFTNSIKRFVEKNDF